MIDVNSSNPTCPVMKYELVSDQAGTPLPTINLRMIDNTTMQLDNFPPTNKDLYIKVISTGLAF